MATDNLHHLPSLANAAVPHTVYDEQRAELAKTRRKVDGLRRRAALADAAALENNRLILQLADARAALETEQAATAAEELHKKYLQGELEHSSTKREDADKALGTTRAELAAALAAMAAFEQAALQRELNREDATSSPVGTPELGRRRLGGGRRSASRAAEERREARSVTEATSARAAIEQAVALTARASVRAADGAREALAAALVKLDLDRTPRLAAAAAGAALCAELLGRLGQTAQELAGLAPVELPPADLAAAEVSAALSALQTANAALAEAAARSLLPQPLPVTDEDSDSDDDAADARGRSDARHRVLLRARQRLAQTLTLGSVTANEVTRAVRVLAGLPAALAADVATAPRESGVDSAEALARITELELALAAATAQLELTRTAAAAQMQAEAGRKNTLSTEQALSAEALARIAELDLALADATAQLQAQAGRENTLSAEQLAALARDGDEVAKALGKRNNDLEHHLAQVIGATRASSVPQAEAHWRASVALRESRVARERRVSAQFSQLAYSKRVELLTAQLQSLPPNSRAAAILARLEAMRHGQRERWSVRKAQLQAAERYALTAALDAIVRVRPSMPGAPGRHSAVIYQTRQSWEYERSAGSTSSPFDEPPVVEGQRVEYARPQFGRRYAAGLPS